MLFDSHCHLTHEKYGADLPEVLTRAGAAGVTDVLTVASDLQDAGAVRALLQGARDLEPSDAPDGTRLPKLWGTAGVHPHEARHAPSDLHARLVAALTTDDRVVAVGECGLDYHYDFSPPAVQRKVFRTQLDVALELDLPVVVHCREAEREMADWVRGAGESGIRGVLHCFPGDLDLLASAVDAGWCVSFTGMVTFRSFDGEDAVRTVPDGRYMLETDGPYMAPVPHRGRRNEPALVSHVRDRIAEIRGQSADEVQAETTRTARLFLRLPEVMPA